MVTTYPIKTIISDSNTRNRHFIIAGTTVRVLDIVASHLYRGLTAEELATNFKLTLSQIHACLAFYYAEKTQIDKQLRAENDTAKSVLDALAQDEKLIRIN